MIDKLNKLKDLCKAQIHLDINPHKSSYQTVAEYLEESDNRGDYDEDVLDLMVQKDTIIDLQYYPDSPIGFYCVFHYDLEKAIDEALSTFDTVKETNSTHDDK